MIHKALLWLLDLQEQCLDFVLRSEWQSSLSFLKTMASKGAEPNTLSCSGAVSACEKASGSLWHVALSLSVMASPDVVSHSAPSRQSIAMDLRSFKRFFRDVLD